MIGKTYEEHVKYRNEQLRNVTKDLVITKFDDYIKNRMEVERASYESKIKDDNTRFLDYLMKTNPGASEGAKWVY